MPRFVRHTATDPVKIDPATWPRDDQGNLKPIFVCACGVSKKYPLCDGSHKACRTEEPGFAYIYDQAGNIVSKTADHDSLDTPPTPATP